MDSKRFKTAATKSKAVIQETEPVTSPAPQVITRLSNSDDNTAIVATYNEYEQPIKLHNKDKSTEDLAVRVMIANRGIDGKGLYVLLLSNNRIYVTTNLHNKSVYYNQELGYNVHELNVKVGDLLSLVTDNQVSLVGAINEVCRFVSCSRQLIGMIEYIVENENQLPTTVEDMTRCFRLDTKRFYYYSKALDGWVSLPKGWAKLHYIVRTMEELPKSAEIGELAGALIDGTVWQLRSIEGDQHVWDIVNVVDKVGDEYVVQDIITKKKQASGSLILTESGWKFIFSN